MLRRIALVGKLDTAGAADRWAGSATSFIGLGPVNMSSEDPGARSVPVPLVRNMPCQEHRSRPRAGAAGGRPRM